MSGSGTPGGRTLASIVGGGGRNGPKRITRTGLALVHENEIVYPAAGSAAQAVAAIGDAKGAVQVYFPVQIEIRDVSARETSAPADTTEDILLQAAAAIDP
ncbi:hypothetical protein L0664_15870 [Octadecabacter sp. G9-8]|uniref:Uncharacterized protein n=1 Tax=Octadecabacter dasysiphoniae TaxID=2909341 RepID=A0ABS9CZD4_9RHOB|nr:hypothetical protein [Octadecabacter dasysiphoniae]MCF2872554.1 hypothetical protein [Octadecabacter dasysiphoniae]